MTVPMTSGWPAGALRMLQIASDRDVHVAEADAREARVHVAAAKNQIVRQHDADVDGGRVVEVRGRWWRVAA